MIEKIEQDRVIFKTDIIPNEEYGHDHKTVSSFSCVAFPNLIYTKNGCTTSSLSHPRRLLACLSTQQPFMNSWMNSYYKIPFQPYQKILIPCYPFQPLRRSSYSYCTMLIPFQPYQRILIPCCPCRPFRMRRRSSC